MRALQTHDVFKAMRVVNALGVKEEVQRLALSLQGKKKINEKELGAEFILNIIAHAGNEKAEQLIYEFLSGPLEIEPDVIRVMDPLDLIKQIKNLNTVIDMESWKAFFQSVALMTK